MVNSTDIYEKLGEMSATIDAIKEDCGELRVEVRDHNNKIDCIDRKVTEVRTNVGNHLTHHDRWFKIFIAVICSAAGIITLAIKFL